VTLENRENLEKKNQNPVFLGLAALHYSRLWARNQQIIDDIVIVFLSESQTRHSGCEAASSSLATEEEGQTRWSRGPHLVDTWTMLHDWNVRVYEEGLQGHEGHRGTHPGKPHQPAWSPWKIQWTADEVCFFSSTSIFHFNYLAYCKPRIVCLPFIFVFFAFTDNRENIATKIKLN
jgi:hypothetical protein